MSIQAGLSFEEGCLFLDKPGFFFNQSDLLLQERFLLSNQALQAGNQVHYFRFNRLIFSRAVRGGSAIQMTIGVDIGIAMAGAIGMFVGMAIRRGLSIRCTRGQVRTT